MKFNFKQNKFLITILACLILAALAWLNIFSGRIFGVPGLSQTQVQIQSQNQSQNRGRAQPVSETIATKVIDGDTIVVQGGDHIRLLGIDADEKDYPCYGAARARLEELVLGKAVSLEADSQDSDQYGRKLRYVFLNGKNINEEIVAEGLAVARFYPENQKYKTEIISAEAGAIKNKIGCKWSGEAQTAGGAIPVEVASEDLTWKRITDAKIVDACAAKDYVGKEIVVQGAIIDSYASDSRAVFLNFGEAYPKNCFTVVIFESVLDKFPQMPETVYSGKIVRVKGKVIEYRNKPEIILNNPEQIEIGNGR